MISRSQVQHVAHLARLALTPAEEERFTEQLGSILAYVEQLSQLDTTGIDPVMSERSLTESLRPEQSRPWAVPGRLDGQCPGSCRRLF